MRNKFTQQGSDVQGDDEEEGEVDRSQGATRAISSYIDPALCWEDIPWFQSITKMKILLKGIQCGEDAVCAFKLGLHGCVSPTMVDVSSTPADPVLRSCLK